MILSNDYCACLYPFGNANWRSIIHRFCCFFIALYLPTVFVGGGRIATITVEAVSLAANGSRGPAWRRRYFTTSDTLRLLYRGPAILKNTNTDFQYTKI